MITIPNKDFKSSNIMLQQIINSTTKVKMLKVCKKFDLYVSPNLRKDETSRRIALEVLDNPIEILSRLSKTELQILDEFVRGGDDIYVVRKQRKTPYILQKYLLVVTYCDDEKNEWHMLMPTELREPPILLRLCDERRQGFFRQRTQNHVRPPALHGS